MSPGAARVKDEPGASVTDHVVKEEAGTDEELDYVKEEPLCGISEAAMLAGLYTDHIVKDELVLGPEDWHRPKIANAPVGQARVRSGAPLMLRECSVLLECILSRVTHVTRATSVTSVTRVTSVTGDAPQATRTIHADGESDEEDIHARVNSEKICHLCTKTFARKSDLMKHAMAHIYTATTEQKEDGRNASERASDAMRGRYALRECCVLLDRLPHTDSPILNSNTDSSAEICSYVCDACGKSFKLKDHLVRHIRIHLRDKSKTSENSQSLFRLDDTGELLHSCGTCGKYFSDKAGLHEHRLEHTGTPAGSGIQPSQLSTSPRPKVHTNSTSTGPKVQTNIITPGVEVRTKRHSYWCEICKKHFMQLQRFNMHKRNHMVARPYSCKMCEKEFPRPHHLEAHKRVHTGERPYLCEICKKRFKQYTNLQTHKRVHTGERPYLCEICKKRFNQHEDLQKHKRVHTGERPYSCDICQKRFTQSSNLNRHNKSVHIGEKLYSCEICKKRFARSNTLRCHIRTHTGKKPYSCEICKKKFGRSSAVTLHMRIHTGEKPYSCEICKKKFARSSAVTLHMRLHTGEKPYSCDICNMKFAQSSHVISHKRMHSAEKPYRCDICEMQFSYLAAYKKHKQQSHR